MQFCLDKEAKYLENSQLLDIISSTETVYWYTETMKYTMIAKPGQYSDYNSYFAKLAVKPL